MVLVGSPLSLRPSGSSPAVVFVRPVPPKPRGPAGVSDEVVTAAGEGSEYVGVLGAPLPATMMVWLDRGNVLLLGVAVEAATRICSLVVGGGGGLDVKRTAKDAVVVGTAPVPGPIHARMWTGRGASGLR